LLPGKTISFIFYFLILLRKSPKIVNAIYSSFIQIHKGSIKLFYLIKIPIIKFGKCFPKFMIEKPLVLTFSRNNRIPIIKIFNLVAYSSKSDKLRQVCSIWWAWIDIAIKTLKIDNIEIKIIALVINVDCTLEVMDLNI